jgi:hypothetical protein
MTDALETSKAMTEQSKQQLDYITRNENVLKLQGKTEREILNIKIKATEEGLLALKNQIQAQKVIADAQIKTAERNREIASGIIQFLTAPLQGLLGTIDLIGEAVGKNFGLRDKFNNFAANLLFNPEEAKKKADEDFLYDLKEKYTCLIDGVELMYWMISFTLSSSHPFAAILSRWVSEYSPTFWLPINLDCHRY